MINKKMTRRTILKNGIRATSGMVASGSVFCLTGFAQEPDDEDCRRIVPTERGPFYPRSKIPWDADLTASPSGGERPDGQILYLFGKILDPDCGPIKDARVEIWQADSNGRYNHPRDEGDGKLDPHFGYFGHVMTKANGMYLFKTIVPAAYSLGDLTRAPHIHIGIRSEMYGGIATEVYFEGREDDRIRDQDRVFQSRRKSERLIVPIKNPEDFVDLQFDFDNAALCCHYDLAYAKNRKPRRTD